MAARSQDLSPLPPKAAVELARPLQAHRHDDGSLVSLQTANLYSAVVKAGCGCKVCALMARVDALPPEERRRYGR